MSILDTDPGQVVAQALIDAGGGTDPSIKAAWPVYDTREPNLPDRVVTVYGTQGTEQGQDHVTFKPHDLYGIQLRIRSGNPIEGREKAHALRALLCSKALMFRREVELSGKGTYLIQRFANIGQVLSLGEDAPTSKRSVFTVNAQASIRKKEI